jgi:hypothetical protein
VLTQPNKKNQIKNQKQHKKEIERIGNSCFGGRGVMLPEYHGPCSETGITVPKLKGTQPFIKR